MLCLSYYAYVFSSTKLERRAEQILPGSVGGGGQGWGDRGEKWPKQCMHMWKNELKQNTVAFCFIMEWILHNIQKDKIHSVINKKDFNERNYGL
jgi:hypothetical protein